MIGMIKYSPISFDAAPQNRETRAGFEVILKYREDDDGTVLVDLSHRSKWDLQDRTLNRFRPWELNIPDTPGASHFDAGLLINRMNRTQASVWHLGPQNITSPTEPSFTDITDGLALLALVGQNVLSLMEKVCRLDLTNPGLRPPVLIQGPVLHIPSQVVLLGQVNQSVALLIAFSRGYGQAMAEAFLKICQREGLRPGGEDRFTQWMTIWRKAKNGVENE